MPKAHVRRCLLLLGAAGLASGRPVDEVESELRRMGRALGEAGVQCAATPTGLFVSLGPDEAAGFHAVGAPLRFDQSSGVSRIVDAVLAGGCDPDDAIERLDAVLAAAPLVPRWAAAAGLIPVSAGIGLILQPAPENLLAAVLCSVLVAVLIEVATRSRLALTLLPVVAAFTVGCAIFLAARADLLDGPLRTLLAPLAVLLPGALIVTGMSELAAGAMVAGTSRLVFGTVQLLLFSAGVLAAARVVGVPAGELANVRVEELGNWAAWVGLVLLGVGVCLNLSAPSAVLPYILALLALTFLAQSAGQEAYGAPFGGFAGGLTAALGAAVIRWRGGPPTLVVFLPSFWLLVPGSLGLIGTTQLATETGDGFATASGAIAVIVTIALGVLVGSALGRALSR
ncbi:threonine/serine exporter family protein [Solirubrobacter ginsenosidimutans]|uniref:Threonine/serine exporter family protein n=1 Tax=Solirubrobacter ginsenosidimutans TaxID=490573 RepID=A0A9X3MSG7_9ACTN|nr:threonine/serine exporter family protein [Solirubrobacter ginsenosidimutans]MDA0161562.1 threonine/serine exporter family protein [Solirubrobacter ginsenosidimutans]